DSDGAPDLFVGDIVGDGSDGATRPGSGVGHVFYDAAALRGLLFELDAAPAGLAMTRIVGGSAGDISSDTAAAADFDGDGIADLAIASPHASPLARDGAGAVHVLFGKSGRWPPTIDLAPGALPTPEETRITWVLGAKGAAPNDVGDTLAYSAAVADLDDDGRSELVTNEMLGNGVASRDVDAGNLIVLSGARLAGLPACGDGLDNDGDDAIDHPADPGCTGPDGDSERARILLCSPLDPVCGQAAQLDGSRKLKIKKTAKRTDDTSAQLGFGIGNWSAMTDEGILSGAYAVVGKKRRKLELTLDADSLALLLDHIAEEATAEAGVAVAVELRGLPKVKGKLRKAGTELDVQWTIGLLANAEGRQRKGKYRLKLRGPLAPES
ncbi:MAG: FG-GAP repeat protein, partial [Myxococcota bacterium]